MIAAAAAVVLLTPGDAVDEWAGPPSATPAPTATATATPAPAGEGTLAVGITEPNPAFVSTGATHEPFERWREELARVAPRYYRLVLDWSVVAPRRGEAPRLDVPIGGCMRATPPCASWNGVSAQLRALASRQREQPGRWQALVVPTGTPRWAAGPRSACEPSDSQARSRAPRRAALAGYREVVGAVLAAAAREGAELRYWTPWNEPNHPYFLSPQRRDCSARSPSVAPGPYAALARALRAALDAAPGEQEVVLGELAGLLRAGDRSSSVAEFVRGLPREVVCGARIWGQHGYIGGPDPVDAAARALRRFACGEPHEIWITETGAGGAEAGAGGTQDGGGRSQRRSDLVAGCRRMDARLERWYRDPRVTAAFQYTFREDDLFPTGLVTTAVDRAYPTLALWQRWGGREHDTDPPPRPSGCA